jgi:hypothetical protein
LIYVDIRLLCGVQHFEDTVKVFEGLVLENDLAFAVLVLDLNAQSEGALELLLGFAHIGIEDALGLAERNIELNEIPLSPVRLFELITQQP